MRGVLIGLLLTFALPLGADSNVVKMEGETPVYETPELESDILFYLHKGDQIHLPETAVEGFYEVHLIRAQKRVKGYVLKADIVKDEWPADAKAVGGGSRGWAFGGGGSLAQWVEKGRSFQTSDEVQWTTTNYVATFAAPWITAQLGESNFWRLTFAEQKVVYKAQAQTDIVGSSTQNLQLTQNFLALTLQRAWTPFRQRTLYLGLGADLAQSTSVNLILGGQTLPTTSQNQSFYAGAMGFVGGQWFLTPYLSFFVDLRGEVVPNQSPIVYGYELATGLLLWPSRQSPPK